MRSLGSHWLVPLLTVLLLVLASHAQPIQDSDVRADSSRLRELLLLRRIIADLDAQTNVPAQMPKRKRTCYINAGLSHGCDYKDLVGAMAEKNYWDSFSSPGRKRRSIPSFPDQYQSPASLDLSGASQ